MVDFTVLWTDAYGDTPPQAWRLRASHAAGWVRFHCLPGSQRYAGNEAEAAEILRRVSLIGDAALGHDAPCRLTLAQADGEYHATPYETVRKAFGLTPAYRLDDPEEDDLVWTVHAAEVCWSGETFAPLLRMIADDEIADALWLGASGTVLAPYDGGVDVFMRPADKVEALRARFSDWLSPLPSGL